MCTGSRVGPFIMCTEEAEERGCVLVKGGPDLGIHSVSTFRSNSYWLCFLSGHYKRPWILAQKVQPKGKRSLARHNIPILSFSAQLPSPRGSVEHAGGGGSLWVFAEGSRGRWRLVRWWQGATRMMKSENFFSGLLHCPEHLSAK